MSQDQISTDTEDSIFGDRGVNFSSRNSTELNITFGHERRITFLELFVTGRITSVDVAFLISDVTVSV